MSKNKESYIQLSDKIKNHKEKLGDDLDAKLKKDQINIFLATIGETVQTIQKKNIPDNLKRKEIQVLLNSANNLWEKTIKKKYSIGKTFASEKMKLDKDLLIQFFDQKLELLKKDIKSGDNIFIENKYLDNDTFGDGIKGDIEESQSWDNQKLTEKIKEIELSGEITSESLDELFDDILSEAKEEDKPGIISRINEIKTKDIYKKGFSLKGINNELNKYVDTINTEEKFPFTLKMDFSNSLNPLSNNGGLKEVTFNTKEEALRAIYKMKLIFDGSSTFDLTSYILGGIGNFTQGTLKVPYEYMWRPLGIILYNLGSPLTSSEEALWGLGITYLGLGGIGYVMLKRKLETANSGIDKNNIESLKQEIEKMKLRYSELGMKEESKNLEHLYKKISSIKFEEKGNGTTDLYKAMKAIYIELNTFRGTPAGDLTRFGTGWIGSILDQKSATPNFKNSNGERTIFSTLKGLSSLYIYPVKLGSTLVNKGPNWWKIWYTKSEAILDYETTFKATNQKFDLIWDKIDDQINGLSGDEKEELKKEILKKYKSDIWTAKSDPLIKIKINPKLIGPEEKSALFSKLENILAGQGQHITINKWKDFWINFKVLNSGKKDLLKDFAKTLNPIESLGRITADTISNYIKGKPGVTIPTSFSQDIQNEINTINKNADEYIKKMPEILKAKNKFNDFIKYYPEIDEKTEEKILELNKNISGTTSGEETLNKVIENINNELGTNLTKNNIKKFLEDNDIKNNIADKTKFNNNISQSTNILDEMLRKSEITRNEYIDRESKIQDLFKIKTRTFWEPHLSLIIDNIIETGNNNYTNKYTDVINFENNPNYGGGSIHNYFIKKEKMVLNRDVHLEKFKNIEKKGKELEGNKTPKKKKKNQNNSSPEKSNSSPESKTEKFDYNTIDRSKPLNLDLHVNRHSPSDIGYISYYTSPGRTHENVFMIYDNFDNEKQVKGMEEKIREFRKTGNIFVGYEGINEKPIKVSEGNKILINTYMDIAEKNIKSYYNSSKNSSPEKSNSSPESKTDKFDYNTIDRSKPLNLDLHINRHGPSNIGYISYYTSPGRTHENVFMIYDNFDNEKQVKGMEEKIREFRKTGNIFVGYEGINEKPIKVSEGNKILINTYMDIAEKNIKSYYNSSKNSSPEKSNSSPEFSQENLNKLKSMSPELLKLILEEHGFEESLKMRKLELKSLTSFQEHEFKHLIKDLKKGGKKAEKARDNLIEKIKELKKVK